MRLESTPALAGAGLNEAGFAVFLNAAESGLGKVGQAGRFAGYLNAGVNVAHGNYSDAAFSAVDGWVMGSLAELGGGLSLESLGSSLFLTGGMMTSYELGGGSKGIAQLALCGD